LAGRAAQLEAVRLPQSDICSVERHTLPFDRHDAS